MTKSATQSSIESEVTKTELFEYLREVFQVRDGANALGISPP